MMLRNVANICLQRSSRRFVTEVKAARIEKRTPLITCKNTGLNLYGVRGTDSSAKLGQITLASNGWKHRKSKGDFFTINPILELDHASDTINAVDFLKSFNVCEKILQNLSSELNIKDLTYIQHHSLSKIIDMNHVLIAAETGCGKTLAYLIPIVQQILQRKSKLEQRKMNTPLALILTPGRELATQIGVVINKICEGLDINTAVLLGGSTKQKMINPEFKDVDILVATMGAISKLTTTGIYRMEQVRHVVLDEADTLLDDSFSPKLCHFLKRFPFHKNHLQDLSDNIVGAQLIMVSATMPTNINELLNQIIDTETIHEVVSPNLHHLMRHIKHKFIKMNKSDRPGQLLTLVKAELNKKRPVIVFGNKSATSDFISLFLNDHGVECVNLNGDMLMKIRIGRFEKFQTGEVDVLATTDVASRGLDTTRARHVVNFDFPLHVSDYIHRCGRIGRVGSHYKCTVTNFISSRREIDVVQKIEHAARTGGILPDVNANITNIIYKRIIKDVNIEGNENIF